MLGLERPKSRVPSGPALQPALIRLQKELESLKTAFEDTREVQAFPDPDDITAIEVVVQPGSGFWKKGRFTFDLKVPLSYPHNPPKVRCRDQVFHPNIDKEGRVCLNILGLEWNPVLTIFSVCTGLLHLFLAPQTEDPLNKDAAALLAGNEEEFGRVVTASLRNKTGGVAREKNFEFILS